MFMWGSILRRRVGRYAFYLGTAYHKHFAQPPDPEVLVDYLRRNFSGASYHTVYEAGYFGFWVHRELIRMGVDSIVINPADVPRPTKSVERKRTV